MFNLDKLLLNFIQAVGLSHSYYEFSCSLWFMSGVSGMLMFGLFNQGLYFACKGQLSNMLAINKSCGKLCCLIVMSMETTARLTAVGMCCLP